MTAAEFFEQLAMSLDERVDTELLLDEIAVQIRVNGLEAINHYLEKEKDVIHKKMKDKEYLSPFSSMKYIAACIRNGMKGLDPTEEEKIRSRSRINLENDSDESLSKQKVIESIDDRARRFICQKSQEKP